MKPLRNAYAVLACASLLLGQFGCSTTKTLLSSTKYSESAYNTDKAIKAQSLALIDRAKDKAPYTGVAADVDELMKKVDAAITPWVSPISCTIISASARSIRVSPERST